MLDPVMNVWDCAALLPIVEEAGGTFTDWQGQRTIYGGNAISTNGLLFDVVMETIRNSENLMLIIPAIDLRQGKCVRLTQGRKDAARVYDSDPVKVATAFDREGAQMLHVVDLGGAFSEPNSTNRQALREIIRSIDIPVQFGGGIRSVRDVEQVIAVGVTRVVIGTVAVESEKLKTMVRYARQHIVVGIDAKDGQVVTHGWEQQETLSALTLARRVAEIGVERIIYTDVGRDGTLTGPNIQQTCKIASESGLKVTASGGVASLEDLKRLKAVSDCGIDSVIVGKALYEGRFTFREATALMFG